MDYELAESVKPNKQTWIHNFVCREGAMIMATQTNDRYKTILAALNIIDPQGVFAPGTMEHNTITETILSWMEDLGYDEVLRKSETARRLSIFKRYNWH